MTRQRYFAGWTFDQMIERASRNVELWKGVRARATIDEEALRRVQALGGEWHLLVLSEDWCGDAVNTLPFVDALAAATDNLGLRFSGSIRGRLSVTVMPCPRPTTTTATSP